MSTKFMIGGNTVHIFNLNEETALDVLPPKVYSVQFSQLEGFYLNIVKDRLDIPAKIYGNTPQRVQKCIDTYIDRAASTGILLTGDKGTGKSLLMALLANEIIDKLSIPVLLIQDPYAGSQFTSFIETIGECAIVFDEFGKMYNSSNHNGISESEVPQTSLLSLMDGIDKTKRMFIFTENSEYDINDFMFNRPSRVYYHFKYRKLDESSVVGYCADNGVAPEIVQDIVDLQRRSRVFSFDMLQTIVEEQLRYNDSIVNITDDLNIDTREDKGDMIEILKIVDRSNDEVREIFDTPYVNKPSDGYTYIKVKDNSDARKKKLIKSPATAEVRKQANDLGVELDEDEADTYNEVYVRDSDLVYEREGQLVYETEEFIFTAKSMPRVTTNYSGFF